MNHNDVLILEEVLGKADVDLSDFLNFLEEAARYHEYVPSSPEDEEEHEYQAGKRRKLAQNLLESYFA